MIRLTLGQLQEAAAWAARVHAIERARDRLPTGEMLDAATVRTAENPLCEAITMRVPREIAVDALKQQRDQAMTKLREMGIDLDPSTEGAVREWGMPNG